MHPNFPIIVKEAWLKDNPLYVAISNFTTKARKWNHDVFGNLFARKRRVLARISGAHKALANNPNEFLVRLEKQLIDEYSSILLQEEEFWALKSRLNAATFGDRNTSYFHVSTVIRRHRNKIRCIKDDRGDWIADEEGVKKHILAGFENLYTTGLEKAPIPSLISNFSCFYFTEEDQAWVGREVTEEDVRDGLRALKPFKVPGLNGLHVGFF